MKFKLATLALITLISSHAHASWVTERWGQGPRITITPPTTSTFGEAPPEYYSWELNIKWHVCRTKSGKIGPNSYCGMPSRILETNGAGYACYIFIEGDFEKLLLPGEEDCPGRD